METILGRIQEFSLGHQMASAMHEPILRPAVYGLCPRRVGLQGLSTMVREAKPLELKAI